METDPKDRYLQRRQADALEAIALLLAEALDGSKDADDWNPETTIQVKVIEERVAEREGLMG